MAKTLVALYHTMPEAEQVVQDLAQHGFAHSDIRLMTHNGAGRPFHRPPRRTCRRGMAYARS